MDQCNLLTTITKYLHPAYYLIGIQMRWDCNY